MKIITRRTALAAFSLAAVTIAAQPAAADSHGHGKGIMVMDTWARATPPTAKNGAAYFAIHNQGKMADKLVSASADVAKKVEIHNHINEGGVMKMRKVEGGITIPAGGMAELKPGGYHIMFMGLHAPLKEGDSFPMTVTFEKAGAKQLTVKIMKMGMKKGHEHMKMDKKKMN